MSEANSALSRLDHRTYSDSSDELGPRIAVTLRDYGDGFADLTAIKVAEGGKLGGRRRREKDSHPTKREEMTEANLERSLQRAKTAMKRKILAAWMDRMLTLTFRENVTDATEAFAMCERFLRAVREVVGAFPYVYVMERQKRGACHFHIALNRKFDVRLLRRIWLRVVGLYGGNIDMARARNQSRKERRRGIVCYMAKYLTKAFDIENFKGRHRYRASKGITVRPVRFTLPLCPGAEVAVLAKAFYARTGYKSERFLSNECFYGEVYWLASY